ncbi:sodium:proton antiporter [Nocardioides sp. JQ2195]|uniref:cation:proton antiporter domain-containing protein n=1 Tax=Nocardioides sp. JQ2195 TaxID=2592334 RepID=UPI00143EA901|nr:cation:proton antiporter [Nocardioides sp. JQ2195]QIX25520.1 sodium:proton antiporter [Nocardioides sp. JQ2195]
MHADLVWVAAGLSLLLAVVLPELLDRWAISAPMVLVAIGIASGFTSLPDGLPLDPQENRAAIEHVTELVVIVALMGVGLAIDRPLDLRSRASWARWSTTWRLLVVAMPLTIAGVALLGWALGLPAAVALLLGAALAPTDPVLASDVQVAGPQTAGEEQEVDESDELRFALTSEAGFNDSLAFPFVHAAILLAGHETVGDWLPRWIGFDLLGKVVIGVVVGIVVGRALSYAAFRSGSRSLRVAERGESLMALAALVTAYGVGEVVGGYGFLSVFVCAMTFRSAERSHDYHAAMHDIVLRLERLLTLFVLLVMGVALSRGLLESLDWRGVVLGVALVFLVRPLTGILALAPYASRERPQLDRGQRWAAAFFGVRGIGSIFYLAYAAGEAPELGTDWLWSTIVFTIVLSVFVHGVLASPVMRRIGSENPS